MSIKSRVNKIEVKQQQRSGDHLAVINLQPGETQEHGLDNWMAETGKPEPGLVVFIRRFSRCDNITLPAKFLRSNRVC